MNAGSQRISIRKWSGGLNPSYSAITRMLEAEGLRPFRWNDPANRQYPVRSHGYSKVLMVLEGALELTFPDQNQVVKLSPGDRADIPAGVRHGVVASGRGVTCIEAATSGNGSTRRTQEIPPVKPQGR